jgi:hypothetical protein
MLQIPKELHLYWDGSDMSRLQAITVESFHKLNPDWNINIYMPQRKYDGDMKFNFIPDYLGPDYFHTIKDQDYVNVTTINLDDYNIRQDIHDILRSDIFRYHILYNVGGVWSDFDVIWLKPMEHFYNIEYYGSTPIEDVSAIVSYHLGTYGGHSIGIMIHSKGDPYVGSLIQLSKEVNPPFSHEVFGGVLLNQNYPTLESIPYKKTIGARFETYYPFDIHPPKSTIQNLYYYNDVSCLNNNNVMCLHWYNGHGMSKEYINNNGFERDCSMTTILKEGGYI